MAGVGGPGDYLTRNGASDAPTLPPRSWCAGGVARTIPGMEGTTGTAAPAIGSLVRSWRAAKGRSQLDLALEAGISTRHLSFIETGRSNPSRDMVVTLARTLEVPLRERNTWLEAAGYAPLYRETSLEAPSMTEVRAALNYLLEAHGPNPAFVLNPRYDIVLHNDAAKDLVSFFAPAWNGPKNLLQMVLSADGFKNSVENWYEVVGHGIDRMRRELSRSLQGQSDDGLLKMVMDAEQHIRRSGRAPTKPPGIVLPLRLRRDGVELELFTTITTLGTPLDITLQELRIETLFPATAAARTALRSISSAGPRSFL
jgi:transcriptional regulator with XRE-family HTH domain